MIVLQIQIIILIMVLPTINSIISTTRQRPSSNFNTIVNVKSINEAKCNFYSNDDVSLTNYMVSNKILRLFIDKLLLLSILYQFLLFTTFIVTIT